MEGTHTHGRAQMSLTHMSGYTIKAQSGLMEAIGRRRTVHATDGGSTVGCVAKRARVARGPASRPGDACGAARRARVDMVSQRLNEERGVAELGSLAMTEGCVAGASCAR